MKLRMLQGSESSYFHSSSPVPAAHSFTHSRPQVGWRQGHCCQEGTSPALWLLDGNIARGYQRTVSHDPPRPEHAPIIMMALYSQKVLQ